MRFFHGKMIQRKLRNLLTKNIKSGQAGMSLIEILVALTILGLAGAFVTGKIFEQLTEGRIRSANIQIQNLSARLKEYRRNCGNYPETEQGLRALLEKPTGGRECKRYPPGGFIDGGNLPQDPWDNEYEYVSDGKKFTIISFGADGVEGGQGSDADISSDKAEGKDN